ncbi:hypothetical protein [Sporosarcina limicola]|uniref:Membrane-anchored glycerophosphoryl diester phosphodiesterase (GDPDase) n=1 Tax=Sporosarcina limicola TaxID=34101 RepID=A0A927R6Q8_9BACL|nr:hypothetical protein [Sporosarcina limicola]MBE1555209.1 membrane-anchored glycerophosphoryl diester phosphodiesterase (GDPDase) [Sporosarcina limicola]
MVEVVRSINDHAKQNGRLESKWDTEVIASTIVSIFFHTMMSWLLPHHQKSDIVKMFQQHFDVVWGGIR